ncbi:hypothetical protein [Halococcus saccharolyticus]|uniref:hypothetical protein n=1 Tax=Halococcus saccharolyticus TaxID=62319 RepID=UPI00126763C1|nr:hypothetical protein [Halococcus saccharolyticus]
MASSLEEASAADIASPASHERLENYGDNLDHYISSNFTYIPIPADKKYYDRNEGCLKTIDSDQYINGEDSVIDVLEKLTCHPFLLIDNYPTSLFSIDPTGATGSFTEISHSGIGSSNFEPTDLDSFDDSSTWLTAQELEDQFPDRAEEELEKSAYSIITLFDMNKRRTKEKLYPAIAELADILSEKIEREHEEEKSLYPQLRASTIGNWQKDKERGLDVHIAEYMTLTDMIQVITSSDSEFVAECGFSSKNQCQKQLGSVNELRNKIMHANRTLVHNSEDIDSVLNRIQRASTILNNIS